MKFGKVYHNSDSLKNYRIYDRIPLVVETLINEEDTS